MQAFQFGAPRLPPEARQVRLRVREFLAAERAAGRFVPNRCSWSTFDAEFSRRAGAAGFIGVTWPKEYGGQALSSLVRFVITEEMLAAGAPCFAHWIADRQSGPADPAPRQRARQARCSCRASAGANAFSASA